MAKKLIAVLDNKGRLTGTKRVDKPGETEVVLPEGFDLPTDGSYKWEAGAFWPLGHGHPKPSARPPVSEQMALYAMIRAKGKSAPKPARDWADWYDETLRQRDEEQAKAHALKAKR